MPGRWLAGRFGPRGLMTGLPVYLAPEPLGWASGGLQHAIFVATEALPNSHIGKHSGQQSLMYMHLRTRLASLAC